MIFKLILFICIFKCYVLLIAIVRDLIMQWNLLGYLLSNLIYLSSQY
jgi:hypothetical protein